MAEWIVRTTDGSRVASCALSSDEVEANARLITEAPTLYEALTGLIYGADETTKERARARAISAIARVEGQQ
jgi:hypothetical protein